MGNRKRAREEEGKKEEEERRTEERKAGRSDASVLNATAFKALQVCGCKCEASGAALLILPQICDHVSFH